MKTRLDLFEFSYWFINIGCIVGVVWALMLLRRVNKLIEKKENETEGI